MTDAPPPKKPDRADRLAKALRENLRRRKAAAKSDPPAMPSRPKKRDDT